MLNTNQGVLTDQGRTAPSGRSLGRFGRFSLCLARGSRPQTHRPGKILDGNSTPLRAAGARLQRTSAGWAGGECVQRRESLHNVRGCHLGLRYYLKIPRPARCGWSRPWNCRPVASLSLTLIDTPSRPRAYQLLFCSDLSGDMASADTSAAVDMPASVRTRVTRQSLRGTETRQGPNYVESNSEEESDAPVRKKRKIKHRGKPRVTAAAVILPEATKPPRLSPPPQISIRDEYILVSLLSQQ